MILNTSNERKLDEFRERFKRFGVTLHSSHLDLKEIDADPISVVVHKASQVDENVLVEDTSLDIEGAEVGINIKWMLEHLSMYRGRKALWRVLLAYRKGESVYIFEGKTVGTIVSPSGTGGFGFDPVFLPDGYTETLAHVKPDEVDARFQAVKALIENKPITFLPPILSWNGPWQLS